MQLNIVSLKAVKTVVDVANSEEDFRNTTVEELKRIILKYDDDLRQTYPNIEDFRLIFTGRLLDDCDTLGEHGIRHRDTILVVRPSGSGGPPPPEAEDRGMSRTASMEVLASMQQTEPEPDRSCLIL